jgi:hypothetical protein
MAIEIKRTPVLSGDAAKAFLDAIQEKKKQISGDRVRIALEKSRKIISTQKKSAY